MSYPQVRPSSGLIPNTASSRVTRCRRPRSTSPFLCRLPISRNATLDPSASISFSKGDSRRPHHLHLHVVLDVAADGKPIRPSAGPLPAKAAAIQHALESKRSREPLCTPAPAKTSEQPRSKCPGIVRTGQLHALWRCRWRRRLWL